MIKVEKQKISENMVALKKSNDYYKNLCSKLTKVYVNAETTTQDLINSVKDHQNTMVEGEAQTTEKQFQKTEGEEKRKKKNL